jgi:hypothetical protein
MGAKSLRDSLIAVAALIAALAAAYGLDRLVHQMRLRAASTFENWPVLWIPPALNVALVAGFVALVWWLAARAARPAWVGPLYLVVGLAAVLYLPVTMTLGLPRWLPLLDIAFITSYWGFTGALLVVTGVLCTVRRGSA